MLHADRPAAVQAMARREVEIQREQRDAERTERDIGGVHLTLEHAVTELGFIGAHLYPHWFELPANHAKYYPFYAKCIELDVPVQMQVGQSLIYSKQQRCRSVGRPIYLDDIACDLPELKLIGSHVGIPWHDEMIAMAWKHDNVYICTDAHSPSTGQRVWSGISIPTVRTK